MILAFLTFGFALTQVLVERDVVSTEKKFVFAIIATSLSVIPLAFQFVILLGELARAQKYFVKVLVHRLIYGILGSYGAPSNLILKQYRRRKLGSWAEANGQLWRSVLYVGHGFAQMVGSAAFGDAFSGIFTVTHTSVALWMEDEYEPWIDCKRPDIDNNLFSRPRVKDVRDVSLTVEISPIEHGQSTTVVVDHECSPGKEEQSTMVHYALVAVGSRDSLISKLYYEPWHGECSIENARELCRLVETLNNETFVVERRPPDENDQILSCVGLHDILRCILEENKKLVGKRVYGMSYV